MNLGRRVTTASASGSRSSRWVIDRSSSAFSSGEGWCVTATRRSIAPSVSPRASPSAPKRRSPSRSVSTLVTSRTVTARASASVVLRTESVWRRRSAASVRIPAAWASSSSAFRTMPTIRYGWPCGSRRMRPWVWAQRGVPSRQISRKYEAKVRRPSRRASDTASSSRALSSGGTLTVSDTAMPSNSSARRSKTSRPTSSRWYVPVSRSQSKLPIPLSASRSFAAVGRSSPARRVCPSGDAAESSTMTGLLGWRAWPVYPAPLPPAARWACRRPRTSRSTLTCTLQGREELREIGGQRSALFRIRAVPHAPVRS